MRFTFNFVSFTTDLTIYEYMFKNTITLPYNTRNTRFRINFDKNIIKILKKICLIRIILCICRFQVNFHTFYDPNHFRKLIAATIFQQYII